MPRFSERIGARSQPRNVQVESVDDALRNSLWNSIYSRIHGQEGFRQSTWSSAARYLANYHYKVPIDTLPDSEQRSQKWIRERFFEEDWVGVYDFVEFLATNIDGIKNYGKDRDYSWQRLAFVDELNDVLERELSGYRFINGVLSPVTDPVEIAAIEAASSHSIGNSLSVASQHIQAALELLGKKPDPDYRNSVKESISAVESVVNSIAGTDPGGVAKALDQIGTKVEVHGALKAAFKQLYGYTCDEDGIRHAMMEDATVGYDEAKFMLVACSAFVNFLITKANAAGVLQ